eukprot:TRINITY_DN11583_c0_g1_i1.p1 TRINITY_DN11583_c0_g1~~TRINITY_DN11583_c0_g1_i1.p1  ORF type:complete len:118 (-),score=41.48 TRINITY_DN11583_c0_g1_i1:168-521(-)
MVLAAARRFSQVGVRLSTQRAVASRSFSTGIKMMDEREKAAETFFAHQEDERLIRKMIENSPELDPMLAGVTSILQDTAATSDQVKLIFMKHGIPPANKSLVSDITELVEKLKAKAK